MLEPSVCEEGNEPARGVNAEGGRQELRQVVGKGVLNRGEDKQRQGDQGEPEVSTSLGTGHGITPCTVYQRASVAVCRKCAASVPQVCHRDDGRLAALALAGERL